MLLYDFTNSAKFIIPKTTHSNPFKLYENLQIPFNNIIFLFCHLLYRPTSLHTRKAGCGISRDDRKPIVSRDFVYSSGFAGELGWNGSGRRLDDTYVGEAQFGCHLSSGWGRVHSRTAGERRKGVAKGGFLGHHMTYRTKVESYKKKKKCSKYTAYLIISVRTGQTDRKQKKIRR